MKTCRKCNSNRIVKYGFANGNQRYKCKSCGKICNECKFRGKPQEVKDLAVLLHTMFAASFRSIGKLLNVSDVSVYKWVKKYAEKLERPQVTPDCKTILIDEMWHFVNGKKTRYGSGKHMICYQKELLPGRLGSVTIEL
jgi:transposase